MKTDNFINAVNEIKVNGGSRQTIYIREVWRDRCMTIFSYADGTAEVFEDTRPYMHFNSLAEALLVLGNMQEAYDIAVDEDRNRSKHRSSNIHIDTYSSVADWYSRAPRGTYFGD